MPLTRGHVRRGGLVRPEEQVIAAVREMLRRGLVTGTAGDVSMRCDGGMLLTPTRRHPDDLVPGDLIWIGFDQSLPVPSEASLEWRMHAAIYGVRTDVGAVVHTHSPHATARSFDASPLLVVTEERTYLGLDRFRVAPPAGAGSPELANGAVTALGPIRQRFSPGTASSASARTRGRRSRPAPSSNTRRSSRTSRGTPCSARPRRRR